MTRQRIAMAVALHALERILRYRMRLCDGRDLVDAVRAIVALRRALVEVSES